MEKVLDLFESSIFCALEKYENTTKRAEFLGEWVQ